MNGDPRENVHGMSRREPHGPKHFPSVKPAVVAQTNLWLNRPKQNSRAKMRLIAFPYAGAGASVFYPWVNFLPQSIELCCVQLPGREGRLAETAFTRIQHMVRAAAEVFLPFWIGRSRSMATAWGRWSASN